MFALFDFYPSYCPHCGKYFSRDIYSDKDFAAHASFSCPACHCNYQLSDTWALLDAAEASGGDMKRYAEKEGG